MKTGQHVNLIVRDDPESYISGIYACEDHFHYFIVISPGGLTQILTFSKSAWYLEKTDGFTDIHGFLEDQKEYIKALYGLMIK